jgi:hypothetical protein
MLMMSGKPDGYTPKNGLGQNPTKRESGQVVTPRCFKQMAPTVNLSKSFRFRTPFRNRESKFLRNKERASTFETL